MEKVQAIYNYFEGLHASIQSTLLHTKYHMVLHVPSLDITSLRAISHIRAKSHFTNLGISFSPEYLPTKLFLLDINAIQSNAPTL